MSDGLRDGSWLPRQVTLAGVGQGRLLMHAMRPLELHSYLGKDPPLHQRCTLQG